MPIYMTYQSLPEGGGVSLCLPACLSGDRKWLTYSGGVNFLPLINATRGSSQPLMLKWCSSDKIPPCCISKRLKNQQVYFPVTGFDGVNKGYYWPLYSVSSPEGFHSEAHKSGWMGVVKWRVVLGLNQAKPPVCFCLCLRQATLGLHALQLPTSGCHPSHAVFFEELL